MEDHQTGKQRYWLEDGVVFGRQPCYQARPAQQARAADRYKLDFTARGLTYPEVGSGGG